MLLSYHNNKLIQIMKKTKSQRKNVGTVSTFQSMHSIQQSPQIVSTACSITADNCFKAIFEIQAILNKKIANKKRYHFQILKQFYLFHESDISSSYISISTYDPLLFSDQKLHTVCKILESQLTQRLIWGFINLRTNKLKQDLKKMVTCAQNIITKVEYSHKATSFHLIKQPKQVNSANQTENKYKEFQRYQEITIDIKNTVKIDTSEKSGKIDINLSNRTSAESEQHDYIQRRQDENCSVCCHNCCCCNCCSVVVQQKYNLSERIQYMKRLEALIRQKYDQ